MRRRRGFCVRARGGATFDNWRFAAEQDITLVIARAEFQARGSAHERALEFHPSELEVEWGLQKGELAVLLKVVVR